MFKFITHFFFKLKLKDLKQQEDDIHKERAILIYQPALEDIPWKLDELEILAKKLKKINKKKKRINKKMGN